MKPTRELSIIGKTKIERDIETHQEDINKLLKMKTLYDETENLCGGFYSDMSEEIESQIKFLENCIKNLQK